MARKLFTYILKYWVFTSRKLPEKAVFVFFTVPAVLAVVHIVF